MVAAPPASDRHQFLFLHPIGVNSLFDRRDLVSEAGPLSRALIQ
jgi:hypothetical protein